MTGQIEMWPPPVWPGVYGTALLAAAGVAVVGSVLIAALRGASWWRSAVCVVVAGVGAVAGARLLHWATNLATYADEPGRVFALTFNNFSLYGGLAGMFLVGMLACRFLRVDLWMLGDSGAPAVALAVATARAGCLLSGCCFGVPTDAPWGLLYPPGSDVHLHQMGENLGVIITGPMPVHPTQVYEMGGALLAGALAVWLMARKAPAGVAGLSALIAYTAFRLLNQPLRVVVPDTSVPQAFYPALYGAVMVVALMALIWRARTAGTGRAAPAE